MNKQYLFVHLTFYLLLLIAYEVHCTRLKLYNPTECYSNNITYSKFKVDFYFSSKKQYYRKFTSLGARNIDFDPKRRTVISIHGLIPQLYPNLIKNLRNNLIQWGDINLIDVNWKKGCGNAIAYVKAVVNTEYAAIKTNELLMEVIDAWNGTNKAVENWGPLHIIGHSLGAHVAGQIAERLKQNNVLVDRVSGLDPAGPCFQDRNLRLRLKKTCARFVDITHTDGGTEEKFQLGLLDAIGHIDFYVNGGRLQPGCPTLRIKRETINLLQLGYEVINRDGLCQHLRAYPLFGATLEQARTGQCTFWAYPWNSNNILTSEPPRHMNSCDKNRCIEMGINAENYRNASGIFYVPTTGKSPYCKK